MQALPEIVHINASEPAELTMRSRMTKYGQLTVVK